MAKIYVLVICKHFVFGSESQMSVKQVLRKCEGFYMGMYAVSMVMF